MSSKPIPIPPPGTELRWRLEAPYSAKHLLILICVFALLLVTGHRTEMDKMVSMTSQAFGNLMGFNDDSQVVRGFSRVGEVMWPPVVATQEETNRMPELDREDLPALAYIETQEVTT